MKHLASALSVSLVAATAASGQIIMDGTLDAGYGPALSIQNTSTGFGDDNLADPIYGNGSELDAVYGTVEDGYLKLFLAGNLESNFNKMEIFIDSEAGVGQNQLDGANLPTTVDGFCCTLGTPNLPDPADGALQRMSGLKFDAGFAPDYYLTMSHGTEEVGLSGFGTTGWIITAHYAELNNGTSGAVAALGGQTEADGLMPGLSQGELIDQNNNDPATYPLQEFFEPYDLVNYPDNENNHRNMDNTIGLQMGYNNSNAYADDGGDPATVTAGGVIGYDEGRGGWDATVEGFDVLAGQVTTGLEVAIPLSAIGNPSGDIKVTAFIDGTGHDYASNQFSGAGIMGGNLGSDNAGGGNGSLSGVDLSAIAGDQFVTISQTVAIPGDLNGDGYVGLDDLQPILDHWNQNVTVGDASMGDIAGPGGTGPDGYVGLDDLQPVLDHWNEGTLPTPSSVPEPASLALLGLGGLAALRRR